MAFQQEGKIMKIPESLLNIKAHNSSAYMVGQMVV